MTFLDFFVCEIPNAVSSEILHREACNQTTLNTCALKIRQIASTFIFCEVSEETARKSIARACWINHFGNWKCWKREIVAFGVQQETIFAALDDNRFRS